MLLLPKHPDYNFSIAVSGPSPSSPRCRCVSTLVARRGSPALSSSRRCKSETFVTNDTVLEEFMRVVTQKMGANGEASAAKGRRRYPIKHWDTMLPITLLPKDHLFNSGLDGARNSFGAIVRHRGVGKHHAPLLRSSSSNRRGQWL